MKEVTEWHKLGMQLGVPVHTLSTIERDNPCDADRCKNKVLIWWLHNVKDGSWDELARAVEAIEYKVLANKLREKYQGELIFLDCVLL